MKDYNLNWLPKAVQLNCNAMIHTIENFSLDPMCGVLIGSAAHKEFREGSSDIDMVVYLKALDVDRVKEELTKNHCKILMGPRYIEDYQGKRIETFIDNQGLRFDISFTLPELPEIGKSAHEAIQGFFEIHIASIFKHGKVLWGELPNQALVQEKYLPYYGEALRNERLTLLSQKLKPMLSKLEESIEHKNEDILLQYSHAKNIFLQWLFIEKRCYPVNYHKRVDKQLRELPQMREAAIRNILGLNGNSIYEIIKNFNAEANGMLQNRELHIVFERKNRDLQMRQPMMQERQQTSLGQSLHR